MGRFRRGDLEELRQVGDPEADALVRSLLEGGNLGEVSRLMSRLIDNDEPPSEQLPPEVRDYFSFLELSPTQQRDVDAAEDFFGRFGPEIMLVLCCSSLPFDYANKRAVPVLHQTGFLAQRPNLRVAQTAQMIVDVMSPDGLEPDGRGVRSAQKVRLMHAAVRCLILKGAEVGWDKQRLGVPINQADLLYTLMSFTCVVIRGLRRLGLPFSARHAESYYDSWRIVAELIGLRPELIPEDLPEAEELTDLFAEQEQGASAAGREMTQALAGLIGDVLGPLSSFRFSLVRFFVGGRVAAALGIPRRPLLDELVSGVSLVARGIDAVPGRSPQGRALFRSLSLGLMQQFISAEVGGRGRLFRIPSHLQHDWRMK